MCRNQTFYVCVLHLFDSVTSQHKLISVAMGKCHKWLSTARDFHDNSHMCVKAWHGTLYCLATKLSTCRCDKSIWDLFTQHDHY